MEPGAITKFKVRKPVREAHGFWRLVMSLLVLTKVSTEKLKETSGMEHERNIETKGIKCQKHPIGCGIDGHFPEAIAMESFPKTP